MRLLLLHPLPLDGSIWDDFLSIDCDEVIAPTLYGLGGSIEEWATNILERIGHDPFVVAGNSVGGSCALEIARLAPDAVAAIVLIGAKAGHRPEPEFAAETLRCLSDGGMDVAWPLYWEPLFGSRTRPEVLERAHQIALRQPLADLARGVRAFHARTDRSEFLRSWTKPVIVVEGEEDRPDRASEMADSATTLSLHLVPECGHYVPLEQPQVVRRILEQTLLTAAR